MQTAPDRAQNPHPENAAPEAAATPLEGRRVLLRPVRPPDHPFLFDFFTSEEMLWRWRSRGVTPSFDQFSHHLYDKVLAQFVPVAKETGEPMGLVSCYGANFQLGFAYLSFALMPKFRASGWSMEGVALFLNYVFGMWPFRKLYVETVEFNYAQFREGIGKYCREEGRLEKHDFYRGRWWDFYILALYREVWEEHAPRVMPLVLPRAPAVRWVPPAGGAWRGPS